MTSCKTDNERILSTAQAINEALQVMGERDKNVLLFAEGVDDPSAVYGTTKGMVPIYGRDRVIEMPVAENGLCGVAIGAAMRGKRPVISFHRVEFALLAMEQIINNAAKMHYASNGQHKSPLVIRLIIGRGWGQGPQHSQSLESMFACIPGLRVIMPVFPQDTKGMLIAAIEDDSPVVIIEHRWCHYIKGHVEEGYFTENITTPKLISGGDDATIVATSLSTIEAVKATDALATVGIKTDLFDLRVLNPLDTNPIVESFKKTGRLLTVDTGHKTHGIGGEIIAQVMEQAGSNMKCPPSRIALPDHPVPSSRGFIPGLYPDAKKIVSKVCAMVNADDGVTNQALETLSTNIGKLPVDIPDPTFTGPF